MLPSLGFQEILLLGVLALVVVGPKDLPLLLRKIGRWTAKLRAMAQEFRTGFDELARQAELDELKKEVDALRRNQVFTDISNEVHKPLDTPPAPQPLPAPHDVAHGAPADALSPVEGLADETAPQSESAPLTSSRVAPQAGEDAEIEERPQVARTAP